MQMRYFRASQICPDTKRFQIDKHSPGSSQESIYRAELRREIQPGDSADLKEGLQMSRDLGRGKLVEPLLIAGGLELSFFDRCIENKAHRPIEQC
jgi:hypothetical protein